MVDMKQVEVPAAEVPFASDGFAAPTIFVDDIRGVSTINGVSRLNLIENRVDLRNNSISAVIVAVLAVPNEVLKNWGPFLSAHFPLEEPANGDHPTNNP